MPLPPRSPLASLLLAGTLTLLALTARAVDPLPPDAFDHLPPHPRLFADAARWAALPAQIKADPASARLHALLLHEADDVLTRPPIVYEKLGRRLWGPVREARDRLITLAAAARLTADPAAAARYRERAATELRALAALPSWNPSHFLDVAEATTGLAVGYDWLYDALTPADRTLCEDAILRLGLQTSFDSERANLGWISSDINWNQVCHGGLTLGALAVAERDPALARRIVERAAENIPKVARTYAPDGAYPEGPAYWNYGTTYHVLLVDALQSVFHTTLGLEKFPGFLASVDFHQLAVGPTGLIFNYSDSKERLPYDGLVFWFARQLHRSDLWQREMKLLPAPGGNARPLHDGLFALHLIWRQPDRDYADEPAVPIPTRWLGRGENPVVFLRSANDDPRAVFVGLKGGRATLSHAHMDAGSFVLDADGVRWALDPGMQDYNSLEKEGIALWDARRGQRFDVFRLGPDAHNLLRFDGARQSLDADVQFRASRLTGPDPFAILDLASAYPDQAAVRRGVCLRDDRRVLFQDEWTVGPKPASVSWQWMTRAEATADATGATLRQDGQTLRLRVLAPEKFTVMVEDASAPVHPYDAPNPGLRRIVVRANTPAGASTRLAILAEPGSATGPTPDNTAIKPLADW